MKTPPPINPADRIMSAALLIGAALALGLLFYMALNHHDPATPLKPISLSSGEWIPYSGEQLPDQGAASRVVTAVLRQMGYVPDVQFLPWPLAEETAEKSETNQGVRGSYPYVKVPARERLFYYSDPIFEIELAFFYNAVRSPGLAELDSLEKLKEVRILPMVGYHYSEEIEPYLSREIAPEKNNEEAFRRLISDPQIDVVIEARRVGNTLLYERFPQYVNIIRTAPLIIRRPVHLISSKRNPHNLRFIRDFNRVLGTMKENGRLEALQAQALGKIDQRYQVLLEPYAADGFIFGYLKESDNSGVALPRGTRALVEAWGRDYLQPGSSMEDRTARLVRVRILNGPMKDRCLYVDGRSVVLPVATQ